MSSTASVIANLSSSVSTSSSTSTDRLASDKFTFLKLLVAQLSNQDPLNPTEDQDFVAQLAQFTSLEQLQEINTGVGTLNDTMNQSNLMNATSFIGKAVVVSGSQITKLNDSDGNIATSYVYYTADTAFAKAYVTIMDSTGTNIIRQDTIDGKQAGTYYYEWDGKKSDGTEATSGLYQVIIAGVDENDKSVLLSTQFEAQVTSVYVEDGVYYLGLSGGRNVPLTDVVEVGTVSTSTTAANTTYAELAADQAAKASLAADSASSYSSSISSAMTSDEAKSAADKAVSAAATSRAAADSAAEVAVKAREAAESAQTAAALGDYNDAKSWAEKAAEYADAAEDAADLAKETAKGLYPELDFS